MGLNPYFGWGGTCRRGGGVVRWLGGERGRRGALSRQLRVQVKGQELICDIVMLCDWSGITPGRTLGPGGSAVQPADAIIKG